MNPTSKQWRTVIRLSDVAAMVLVVFIVTLITRHYKKFKELIFPLEGALLLIPVPVLRAIAVKEKKKCEVREVMKNSSP
jgi:hypothetical protein